MDEDSIRDNCGYLEYPLFKWFVTDTEIKYGVGVLYEINLVGCVRELANFSFLCLRATNMNFEVVKGYCISSHITSRAINESNKLPTSVLAMRIPFKDLK